MEQRETQSSSIAQWCSRSYRDCHALTGYHTVVWKTSAAMPWQSSADQTEKKHTDIFSRAREGEAACERDTVIKNHTMVLEVVPRTTTTHSGVEGLSGPYSPQGQSNTLLQTTRPWSTRASTANRRSRSSAVLQSGVGGARTSAEW